jgi:Tfp pilus assembly protein PilV
MPKAWSIIKMRNNQRGFSPIELLLAATIFGMLVTTLVGAIIFGRNSTASSGDRARAVYVAEEGVEAVRNIRDGAGFASLADGTYGLAQSGGVWTLSGASDTVGIYNRSVTVATIDTKRKNITTNVTWPQASGNGSVSIVTRITNWVTIIKSWLNAIESGSLNITGNEDGFKVATQGNYAYEVRNGGSADFAIIDVSNPAAPTLSSTLDITNTATNVAVSGNYAYVTSSADAAELQIINVSNPAAPTIVSSFNAGGNGDGEGLFVIGNYVYMARATAGGTFEFIIINVSNPAAPTLSGSYDNNIDMNDVYVDGNYAYVGTNSNTQELLVINISNPATPTLAATLNMSGNDDVTNVSKAGNYLFVTRDHSLYSVNVTNPLVPVEVSSVVDTGNTTINDVDVESTGTYAFIGTNTTGSEFQIVNISNPASMSVVRTVNVIGTGSNHIDGVAYNASLNIVVSAGEFDNKELVTFVPN